jgi:hypothetical protein
MIRALSVLAVVVGVMVIVSLAARVGAEDKLSIKSIMNDGHKGKEAPITTVLTGKADEKTLKQFLEYYEFMATQKPPAGDEESWKKKTTALVAAMKAVIDKKDNALEDLKGAADCKACHMAHKPPKPQ